MIVHSQVIGIRLVSTVFLAVYSVQRALRLVKQGCIPARMQVADSVRIFPRGHKFPLKVKALLL